MRTFIIGIMAVYLSCVPGIVIAEWGHGLGGEHKSIYVPANQQSGWRVESDSKKKPTTKATKPKTAAAQQPPVVASKPLDSDRDGVIDEDDNCEGTPAGVKVDAKGCPLEAKAIPDSDWTLEGIQFESGSDKIKPESQASLNEAAEILRTHTRVVVEIQGHTDSIGDATLNQALSEKRAMAVRQFLVEKGVRSERLEVKGYGESIPVADNATTLGRAQNRRIQFKVLSR